MSTDVTETRPLRRDAGGVAALVPLPWIVHVAALAGDRNLRPLGVRPGSLPVK